MPYIEADFLREYGIDLLTTDMTWRRFCCLLAALTPESAAKRAARRMLQSRASPRDAMAALKAFATGRL